MTSPIPLSADEVHTFVPPSLENVVPTTSFRFRAATERDKKRYGHLLTSEGLTLFPKDAIRAAMLTTLERNWTEEQFKAESAKLIGFWERLDQNDREADPKLHVKISQAEREAVAELSMRCYDVSPFMRRMDADNRRFNDEAPRVAMSMFLAGWSGVPTKFRLEGGTVPFETMSQLERDLKAVEEQARENNIEGVVPGLAYIQLSLHAFHLLNLDEDAEKNSSAPSPSSDTPSGTTIPPRGGRDGASKGAARRSSSSRKTTRATSPKAGRKS